MTEIIAGVHIPDSALVKEATELVRDTTNELIFHHSRRVFLFGTLQSRRLRHQPRRRDALRRGTVPRYGPGAAVPRD